MKKILLLFIGLCLFSCKEEKIIEEPNKKIDPILTLIFDKYPDYQKNDLIKNDLLTELKIKIDSLVPLNYLDDLPLKISTMEKNQNGDGYLITFYTDNDLDGTFASKDLHYNLIGFCDEKTAKSFNQEKKYLIKGKFNVLSKNQIALFSNNFYYKNDFDLIPGILHPKCYIGTFITQIKEAKIYEK